MSRLLPSLGQKWLLTGKVLNKMFELSNAEKQYEVWGDCWKEKSLQWMWVGLTLKWTCLNQTELVWFSRNPARSSGKTSFGSMWGSQQWRPDEVVDGKVAFHMYVLFFQHISESCKITHTHKKKHFTKINLYIYHLRKSKFYKEKVVENKKWVISWKYIL